MDLASNSDNFSLLKIKDWTNGSKVTSYWKIQLIKSNSDLGFFSIILKLYMQYLSIVSYNFTCIYNQWFRHMMFQFKLRVSVSIYILSEWVNEWVIKWNLVQGPCSEVKYNPWHCFLFNLFLFELFSGWMVMNLIYVGQS